jgi:hypothetical protein
MTDRPSSALRRPDARAETVEDLVRLTASGKVRVPEFQRGLRWPSRDVVQLFDSVLFKRRAPAARLHLGPLDVEAFRRLAAKVGADPEKTAALARETIARALDAWRRVGSSLPLPSAHAAALRDHWRRVPLLRDAGDPPGRRSSGRQRSARAWTKAAAARGA